jgi:hypothetical protein
MYCIRISPAPYELGSNFYNLRVNELGTRMFKARLGFIARKINGGI